MDLAKKGYQILREQGALTFVVKGTGYAKRRVKKPTYKIGSGKICPLCGFSGRAFIPAGNPPRQEAECPRCGGRERHRLLWHYIINNTKMTEGNYEILYVSPSTKIVDKLTMCGNKLTTIDLMMENIDLKSDITHLPFRNETFDVIICSHVLEHVPDDHTAMSEMARVLASEGDALIIVPKDKDREHTYEDNSVTSPEARRREFGQHNHVRWYGRDFINRLSKNGFDTSTIYTTDNLNDEYISQYGLRAYSDRTKCSDIHHCNKSN